MRDYLAATGIAVVTLAVGIIVAGICFVVLPGLPTAVVMVLAVVVSTATARAGLARLDN